jgi:hypothetical protein
MNTRGEHKKIKQNFCKNLEAKKSLARPKHRWKDNIKMDLKVLEQ